MTFSDVDKAATGTGVGAKAADAYAMLETCYKGEPLARTPELFWPARVLPVRDSSSLTHPRLSRQL